MWCESCNQVAPGSVSASLLFVEQERHNTRWSGTGRLASLKQIAETRPRLGSTRPAMP